MFKLTKSVFDDEDSIIKTIIKHTNIYFLDRHRKVFWIAFLHSCTLWLFLQLTEISVHAFNSKGLLKVSNFSPSMLNLVFIENMFFSLMMTIAFVFPINYIFIKTVKLFNGRPFTQKLIAFFAWLAFSLIFLAWAASWLEFFSSGNFLGLDQILSFGNVNSEITDTQGLSFVGIISIMAVSAVVLYLVTFVIFKLKIPYKGLSIAFMIVYASIAAMYFITLNQSTLKDEIRLKPNELIQKLEKAEKKTSPLLKIKSDLHLDIFTKFKF